MASFAEAAAIFDRLAVAADEGAKAADNAMVSHFNDSVKSDELSRYRHPPFTWSPSPRGQPPAEISGDLKRSMTITPAHGGDGHYEAQSGPTMRYSRIQELGGPMHGHPLMHWYITGEGWFSREYIDLPKRPYMKPAHERMVASGVLGDIAMTTFRAYIAAAF